MFINPKTAIEEGWVTGIRNPELQVQPNAIDFTLDKLFSINSKAFYISEEGKQMRGGEPMEASEQWNGAEMQNYWCVKGQDVCDGLSDVYVNLPEGVAAQLIIRSTFNRNGLFLTSGLYDSGYKGHLGFALHNRSRGSALIAPGTRVGQVIFVSSDSAGMYAGGWNHDEGTHYRDAHYSDGYVESVPIGSGPDNHGEGL